MHTSDTSAPGDAGGRSKLSGTPQDPPPDETQGTEDGAAPRANCAATTAKGKPCRNPASVGGVCRLHARKRPRRAQRSAREASNARAPEQTPADAAGPLPAADPMERLRLLQEAAERRAFEAHRSGEEEGNGDKDQSFNRNARLVATLARARHAIGPKKKESGQTESGTKEEGAKDAGTSTTPDVKIPPNTR